MKKNNSLIFLVFIMAFISFLCLSFSIAYSYIIFTTSSSTVQNITTDDFAPTVTYEAVSDFALYNRSDDDGLLTEDGVEINIVKDNDYSLFFNVNLAYSVAGLTQNQTTDDFIPPEYIKLAVFDADDNLVMGPVSMANLPVNVISANNVFDTEYELVFGQFPAETTQITYVLKVWIDANIPETYKGYVVDFKLAVHQEPLKAIQFYNLSGTLTDSSGAVSGATVSIQNGNISSTTDENGAYTLTNVPTGTYNIMANYETTIGDVTTKYSYDSIIHIQSGNSVSLTSTGTHNGTSGSYLQSMAYTYYTTVEKILNANSSLLNTGISVASSAYTVPSSYVLTGTKALDSVAINNLNLNVSTGNLVITKS